MEGKASASGSMIPGGWRGFLDFGGSVQNNHQHNPGQLQCFTVPPQQVEVVFPFRDSNMLESGQQFSSLNCAYKSEMVKNSACDEGTLNVAEGLDWHNEGGGEKYESLWHRVKWTDTMVKLLITAVSYIGEGAFTNSSEDGRNNSLLSPKKGKWKAISKVMAERGYQVSPQQCEDKFNDLNKKYKRLNFILGRGTSCKVVENPALLDLMDLSKKAKGDVRKILSCKQLFYQEMCSYHNGNRLYLPHDWALQQSLQFAVKSKDGNEPYEGRHYNPEESDEEKDAENDNDTNEDHAFLRANKISAKKKKLGKEYIGGLGNSSNFVDYDKISDPLACNNVNPVLTEGREGEQLQNQLMMAQLRRLEEQKLYIQAQMLELEKQRIEWLSFSLQGDRELQKMRLQNERLKLENLRLALELKHQQMNIYYN